MFENVKICYKYASEKHTKEYISINFFPVQCYLTQPQNSGVLLLLLFFSISHVPRMLLSVTLFFHFHFESGFSSANISWGSHQINIVHLSEALIYFFHSTYLFSFTLIFVTDS